MLPVAGNRREAEALPCVPQVERQGVGYSFSHTVRHLALSACSGAGCNSMLEWVVHFNGLEFRQ